MWGHAIGRVWLGRFVGPWVQVMDPQVYHPRCWIALPYIYTNGCYSSPIGPSPRLACPQPTESGVRQPTYVHPCEPTDSACRESMRPRPSRSTPHTPVPRDSIIFGSLSHFAKASTIFWFYLVILPQCQLFCYIKLSHSTTMNSTILL
jgi:hypothetical protein